MDVVADRLAGSFGGELILPTDARYDDARRVWNAMIDRRPALVARCRTTADVAAVVTAAVAEGVQLTVRGGGHGIAGHSTCDGGVVVDLSPLHGVLVDPRAGVAHVQGGALLRDLDAEAHRLGVVVPSGTVSHTGVGGLALGGGYGWLTRRYGLTCDNLVGAEVVTAAGEAVEASESSNADLLWALRGGGGNFGAVTRFDFRAHPAPPVVSYRDLVFTAVHGERVLAAFRETVAAAPRETTLLAWVGAARAWPFLPDELHGQPVVVVSVVHLGPLEELDRAAAPVVAAAPALGGAADAVGFLELQRAGDESGAHGLRRYWKGHFLEELSDGVVEALLDRGIRSAQEAPGCGAEVISLGGALGDLAPGDTAFAHRGARFDFLATASWDDAADDDLHLSRARAVADAVAPWSLGVYANSLGDEGDARTRAAYDAATYERLVRIKAAVDPGNVFRRTQNALQVG